MGISNYPQYNKYSKILPDMYLSVSCLPKKTSTLKSSQFFTQSQHFYMVARFYRNPPTETTNPPISTSDKLLKASSSLYFAQHFMKISHHIFPGFRLCCLFLVIIKDFQHSTLSRKKELSIHVSPLWGC